MPTPSIWLRDRPRNSSSISRPKEWNRWGGWANGPKFPSTGYFHVRQVEGKWWFIDPDGCLFWSHGATGVGTTIAETIVSGRENDFESMPAEGDPLRKFVGKKAHDTTYDFYGANLFRKYGGIESLNKAWNKKYGSWDALLTTTEKVSYKNMAADADKCFEDYVDRFFCVSRDTCKEFFPNHLYLGSRLHGEEDPMVMKAAEAYCDVISYNL